MVKQSNEGARPPAQELKLDARTWSRIVDELQLSPQQVRVVGLILRGRCDKQIAAELGLSVPTVRTHLGRVFQRNQLRDRVELILRAFAIAHAAWSPHPHHQG